MGLLVFFYIISVTAASVHIRLLDRETVPEDYQLLRSEEEEIAGDEWVC